MKLATALKSDSWVKPYLKRYWKTIVFAVFLGFLSLGSGAALMFTSGFLISKAASHPANILMIYVPVVLVRTFGISRVVFRYIERLTSHNWVFRLTSDLRKRLYQSLETGFYTFTNKIRLGELLGLLAEDIGHLQDLYLRTMFPFFVAIVMTIGITIGLGFFSIPFALAMLILLFVAVVIFPLVSLFRMGAVQEQQKQLRNQLYTTLTDNVLGVADWMFSGRSNDFISEHEATEKEEREKVVKLHHFAYYRNFALQIFFGLIIIVTTIWGGSHFHGSYGGAVNWIAAFVLCIFPLIDVYAPLSDAAVETNSYADSISQLNTLPAISEDTVKKNYQNGTLSVENLHFAYADDDKEILSGLNLQIPEGQKVAILGKSGSGKSTLAKLIYGGLTASSGTISLAGEELTGDLTDLMSVLHQNPYLFNSSLRNNLRIGNEHATDEELLSALTAVGLDGLLAKLPQGLDTIVDEAGLRFSGGERHRVALARILLKDTPIVILDEATVGLDPITESQILTQTFELLKNKTVIFITHHLVGVDFMDRVIFLENGNITTDGKPETLATTDKHYQQLLQLDRGW